MSSLLQLPLLAQMLGPEATVGVVVSNRERLKPQHLRMATADLEMRIAVASMDGKPHFRAAVSEQSGVLDFEKVEMEVVQVCEALVADEQHVKAILFECVDLPPYAPAVQRAVGLPVFDITTLIGHAFAGLVRKQFTGIY